MEPKVLNAIEIGVKAGEDILSALGHTSAASAVAEYSSLAPVFINLYDLVAGLFKHGQKVATAVAK